MKRFLALDTSTEACSVALWQDGDVLSRTERVGREHTQRLLPMLHRMLAEGEVTLPQVDGFACCVGPGSFAGVRIGVGLVKGLALGLDRFVVPVSSLALLAQRSFARAGVDQAVAAIDARMSEVYLGAYRRGARGRAEPLQPDAVCPPEEARAGVQGLWAAVGTGWGAHAAALARALGEPAATDAEALPAAADAFALVLDELLENRGVNADALMPVYLRDRVALTLEEQARLRRSR